MSNTFQTISPIDGSAYVTRDYANQKDIARTLALAAKTQSTWKHVPISERVDICHRMVEAFTKNKNKIAEEISWMMGRPIRYAAGEVDGFEQRARHMADIAEHSLALHRVTEKPGFDRYITREALGVVFVIAPWNYPYLTSVNAIVPAILAGNTVVLKHSAQTPLCAERIHDAFEAAGLPTGVFNFLHLSHEHTERVIQDPAIRHVCFTGSVAGGAMVQKAAAGRFIGTGLELGGKDPAYIRSDANLDHAVESTIDGAFFNSGQSCCGVERIYVHESLHDDFVEKAIALVKQYKLGRSDDVETTLGPMVRTSAADFVRRQITEAVQQGAIAHIDAAEFGLDKAGTPYIAPQLLTNVDHGMRVMTEETFGPVVGIQRVCSDEEAIELMNDSEFGLTASVFSADVKAAAQIGEKVETGTFFVNRCDYLDPALAWTGVKNSGCGCTLSHIGFEHLTRPKSFHIKQLA